MTVPPLLNMFHLAPPPHLHQLHRQMLVASSTKNVESEGLDHLMVALLLIA